MVAKLLGTTRFFTTLPAGLQSGRCRLERAVIRIAGPDATKFLQGLTTNSVAKLAEDGSSHGQLSSLLNHQGRLLYDIFLFKDVFNDSNGYLLDCDSKVVLDLQLHLQKYRLRTNVTIEDVRQKWSVLAEWGDNLDPKATTINDPRANWIVNRSIVPREWIAEAGEFHPEESYRTIRYFYGVPEGPAEIPSSAAIPLEYNFDIMGGVDFHKGCYLGQELITRTHNRGVVRKRVMPVMLSEQPFSKEGSYDPHFPTAKVLQSSELIPFEEAPDHLDRPKLLADKKIGQLIGVHGNLGLALMRLADWASHPNFVVRSVTGGFIYGHASVPSWWPKEVDPHHQTAE